MLPMCRLCDLEACDFEVAVPDHAETEHFPTEGEVASEV